MHAMITSEFNSSGILVMDSKTDLYERNSIEYGIIEENLNNLGKSIIIGSRRRLF